MSNMSPLTFQRDMAFVPSYQLKTSDGLCPTEKEWCTKEAVAASSVSLSQLSSREIFDGWSLQ